MHIIHESIGIPKIKITLSDKTKATAIISPLPQGYGVTLGNSLRRILLSGLPGTAITAVKIAGADHEYSTIPGVVESILDIILNLRALSLKKHSKDPEIATIPLIKSGKILAKNIKVSSDIEILSPDQHIATCTDADVKGKIEVTIGKGVGFRIVKNEDHIAEAEKGFMLIDANFSPVKNVKYNISPTRVGEEVNLDQLTLEVETDGSLDADKAIKLSADILRNYAELFNNKDAYTDEDFTSSFSKIKEREAEEKKAIEESSNVSTTPIDILGFSQRTLNALVNGQITSVEQLLQTPMSRLTQLRGFGHKAQTELENVLKERGYNLPANLSTANE